MIKKILKFTGILLLVLIIAAFAIPYFFKDRIVEAVKADINKNINAKVDFTDVNLSLFKSFPDFNFSLDELSVTGIEAFKDYSLVKAENIELSLDLMSVISSDRPIEIHTVNLVKPIINIKVLRNGQANYDITKPSETLTDEDPATDLNFLVQLEEYAITDGQFTYDDRLGGTFVELKELNHSGQGAFTQDIFDLITQTNIGSITAKSGGVTYLRKAKGNLDITLNADVPNSKYTIKDNQIKLNALQLNTEGFVQMTEDKVIMDIKYDAPKNNFKNFLSMIPSAYTADFKDVQANGALQFNGFVKGDYNLKTGDIPGFQVNLKVDNADFKYPDLPIGIKGINTLTKINSPSSDLDKMVVDVSSFKMELGNNPFEASVKLWTMLSDPNIDTKMNGTINLEELAKAFPIEGVKKLNGIISSNLKAKTSLSSVEAKDFDNVDMSGDLRIENMDYQSDDYPPIRISDMQMEFTPINVKLDKFDGKLGKSDVQARGTVDNILAYFSPEKTMTGNLTIRSQFFDSNEWMAEPTTEPVPTVEETTTEEYEVFDRFDFTVDGEIKELHYDVYKMRNTKLTGQVTPNRASITDFKTKIGESDFRMNGEITNIFNYLYENETMKGNINLVSNYINVNEFMVEPPTGEVQVKTISDEVAIEAVLVPEKMDFDINADIKKVLYTNIDLNDIKGKMKVANESVSMKDCKAKSMGGNFVMNGTYDTQNPEKPKFDMDYKVNALSFPKAFEKLNTFAALAPIGKFIEGNFNSTLSMSGELGKDMLPDLSTLSAKGFLETINSTLKNFKPLEEFADKLNIKKLKSLNLDNTKNWFDVKDGTVTIKEFPYSTNGIDMTIGGVHGFTSDMTYNVKAKVPRSLLEKSAVVGKGIDLIKKQASKLGINVDQGEFINVAAVISGTITKPKVKLNLLNAEGESLDKGSIIDDAKQIAIDKAADLAKDKLNVDVKNYKQEFEDAKNKLILERDAKVDSIMQGANKRVDNLMSTATKKAEDGKALAKKKADQVKAEAYKQADALVKKAGKNPIKKKAAQITAKKLKQKADKTFEKALNEANKGIDASLDKTKQEGENIKKGAKTKAQGVTKSYDKKIEDLEASMPKEKE